MTIIKKIIIILFILFINCGALYPQKTDINPATLFLSTAPIRAYVSIDGSSLSEETPLILYDLTPGEHHVVIRKLGLKRHDLNIKIESGEIRAIHIELEKDGKPNHSKDGQIYINPVFPKQKTLEAARIAIPILALVSGYFTISDVVYPKRSGFFFSPMTITSYAATAGAICIKITLNRSKTKFEDSFSPGSMIIVDSTNDAEKYYKKGQEMLLQDRFPEALDFYSMIIEENKDSIYFPYALYKIAKIHFIIREYTLAATEFSLITDRYPLPDLYDKSLKSLSDLYLAQGLYTKSIECLEDMIFIDPLYKKDDIDRHIHEIRDQMAHVDNHDALPPEDLALIVQGEQYE